jgi:hypothetical protein
MLSPKIVRYQPNAAVRSRRIDPKEWDDKKLEVMEIMALNHSFHAR